MDRIDLPLLRSLHTSGFPLGRIVLVEFDAHSAWYEASYTMAAQAIHVGIHTDYHVFQRDPGDVVEALEKLGVDVRRARRDGLLRVLDSYTVQRGRPRPPRQEPYGFVSESLGLPDWKRGTRQVLEDESEREILHIDDNDSLLATVNSEEEILDFFHSRAALAARGKRITFLHGFVGGVHSLRFYNRLESIVDGILDFRAWEARGQVEQVARVRVVRGTACDSRWRLLQVSRRGEVRTRGIARPPGSPPGPPLTAPVLPGGVPTPLAEVEMGSNASRVFEYLFKAYVHDRPNVVHPEEEAGWRSLVQIARGIGMAVSSFYPRGGGTSPPVRELELEGLVEARVTPGSRGRGGVSTRWRVVPDSATTLSRLHDPGWLPSLRNF
jgi:KaiC/GvpD/RAD55 family RecA-like ATPase